MRKVLLLEPNYKNKYPPIGLMKIATYHRILGDDVVFYKGEMSDFFLSEICQICFLELCNISSKVKWSNLEGDVKSYIKTRRLKVLKFLTEQDPEKAELLEEILRFYSKYYRNKEYSKNPQWDRVYVTTLFTFYWKKTIETIEAAKLLVKDKSDLMVGGVMASLLSLEIEEETGIKPFAGLLDKPGIIDVDNDLIIDDLALDYSILDEIDYVYPTGSAYFTFMTKGCTRKCSFCSVPILEPIYKPKIDTFDKFQEIKEKFGEQRNLLLMDNNVLASPKFSDIIDEIKAMGFYKGATFIEPNQYEIAIKNLRLEINDNAYKRRIFRLLQSMLHNRIKGEKSLNFLNILQKYDLLDIKFVKKENLITSYEEISPLYEAYRDKSKKLRYVDFNQGTDARYVTEELMSKMSEIPIRPLRIAFDYIGMHKKYTEAVKLAAKYGIKELSNYLLYNFKDKPEDLYNRMKINIDLARELEVNIFSFPMKYIPLFGEDAKHRKFVGKHWNKKYVRAIQSVLNVTKGIVASGGSFFEIAFGKNVEEFKAILYMPETYIVYRKIFEECGLAEAWKKEFQLIIESEFWHEAKGIIDNNEFKNISSKTNNPQILALLKHYTIKKEDVEGDDSEISEIKLRYQKLIKEDRFVNLTLTYDFE